MNPGMVNHMVKHGLMVLARDEYGAQTPVPSDKEGWAQLAKKLEVQMIQISERDTQLTKIVRKPGEFTCTWCVSSMMDECSEPSQVPLGTHEPAVPVPSRPGATIRTSKHAPPTWFSDNMAALNCVRSWNPIHGAFMGNLIPVSFFFFVVFSFVLVYSYQNQHDETFSVSDFLTPKDGSHRPTMMFAYQPSDDSILSVRDWLARYVFCCFCFLFFDL